MPDLGDYVRVPKPCGSRIYGGVLGDTDGTVGGAARSKVRQSGTLSLETRTVRRRIPLLAQKPFIQKYVLSE